MFRTPPPPLEGGIYRALPRPPRLPLAQRSNFWPMTARLYEPLWRHRSLRLLTGGAYSTARELVLLTDWLAPRAGERVLDLACSTGLYGRTLLDHQPGLTLHALDMSPAMLKVAKAGFEAAGLEAALVQADVAALPYEDAVFDAVVCGGSLNEFTDLPRALAEVARVLKPGGRVFAMYLSRARSRRGRGLQALTRLSGLAFLEPDALASHAAAAGLQTQRAEYRGPVAMALLRRQAPPSAR